MAEAMQQDAPHNLSCVSIKEKNTSKGRSATALLVNEWERDGKGGGWRVEGVSWCGSTNPEHRVTLRYDPQFFRKLPLLEVRLAWLCFFCALVEYGLRTVACMGGRGGLTIVDIGYSLATSE